MKVAIYGKGGIGKSTISANVSAALAEQGLRILQIGCDPKHDSTRLILGAPIPRTVLAYVKETFPQDRHLADIVFEGFGGIACVEAGGPEPGVGCAGRGIITMFDLLSTLGLDMDRFDLTLFDVLGDVVCGGFAVPVRSGYADAVCIVTSGEYMSLYAANNILKGIQNFTRDTGRVAGIIFNERGIEGEADRVTRFAQAVRLPILARIPRSPLFGRAEKEGKTLIELFPASHEAGIIRTIATHISSIAHDSSLLYHGYPLSDEQRDLLILEQTAPCQVVPYRQAERCEAVSVPLSPSVRHKRPLIGCAFAGAVVVTSQISDAATVMHAPASCALMITEKILDTAVRASSFSGAYDGSVGSRLFCTNLTDSEFIYGGHQRLIETLHEAVRAGFSWIFIITSCVPGIIGDRIAEIIAETEQMYPGVRIVPVLTDGNITGDFSQGMILAYQAVIHACASRQISQAVRGRSVTIVAQRVFAPREEQHLQVIEDLLARLDIPVVSRFPGRNPISSLMQALDSDLFLAGDATDLTGSIRELVSSASSSPFLAYPLPVGFKETCLWLESVGDFFGCQEKASLMIADARLVYEEMIVPYRQQMQGQTLLITTQRRSVDWIIDLAHDLGMTVLRVGLLYSPFNDTFDSRYDGAVEIVPEYSVEQRSADIRTLLPDLVLYSYPHLRAGDDARSTLIPYSPGFGFFAGIAWAERWSRVMQVPPVQGWVSDGEGAL